MPGAVFHLTARTHRKEHWFEPIRSEIVELIGDCLTRTDARLLAYVVMPNHLHLVVWHQQDHLKRLMQPLLRRTALRVHNAHAFTGCVLERRYRHRVCADPEYLRNSIVYTHLNPVRAGLCSDPRDYEWSSHATFSADGEGASPSWLRLDEAIALFGREPERSRSELAGDYEAFVRWRMAADRNTRLVEAGKAATGTAPQPFTAGGDAHWVLLFRKDAPAAHECLPKAMRPDLRDIAHRLVAEIAPGHHLDRFRGRAGGPIGAALRKRISRGAAGEGYRNRQIAEFLGISASQVSRLNGGVPRG